MGGDEIHQYRPEEILRIQTGLQRVRKLARFWSPDRHGYNRLLVRRERDSASVEGDEKYGSRFQQGELRAGAEGIHRARGGRCVSECGSGEFEGVVW